MSEFLQLGEHISIQKGKPPLLIPFHGKGAEIYLSPEYLRNRTVGISAKASSDAVRVSDGATVLLWDGSNAGEFFKAKEGIVASTMARITPDANFYPAFFFYLLKHAERILKNQTNGTGIPHVDKEILENISVFCPGDAQQRKIAEVLNTLDTAIHQTEAIVEKLKQVKQGLLHDLLTRGVDANGELRPSYEQAPELYQDSPLGWVPKDWEIVTLGQIASRSSGILQTGPFGSQLHAHEYVADGVPVVMPQDMIDGRLSVQHIARITTRKAVALSRHRLIPNDIVFSRRGDLSRCVAIEDEHTGWLCGTGCLLARLPKKEINGFWLALVYQQPGVQSQVLGRAVGSTMANLNTAILAELTIARPIVDEQNEITLRLKAATLRMNQELADLAKLRQQKIGLMDDLLTGRVRVTPLLAQ